MGLHGYEVRETNEFHVWLGRLKDREARAVIARRIDRISQGNLGDVKSVGDGVSELRIDYGPGYRVYFVKRRLTLIVLLCGGDKKSQARDIERAKTLSQEV